MQIEDLQDRIGGITGIPWSVICGGRRTPSVVRARWVMLYCLNELYPWLSLQERSRIIGRDCHGTAIHGWKKADELYESDELFRAMVDHVLDSN